MQLTNDARHDEINLFRLVRRLEKSVLVEGAWDADTERTCDEIRVRAQKEMQKVKYARRLVRSVEGSEGERGIGSSEHTRRVNAVKMSLDKIEAFLKDTETRYTLPAPRAPSLLDQLPPPRDVSLTPLDDPSSDKRPGAGEGEDGGQTTPKATSSGLLPPSLSLSENDNFLLSPPDTIPGLPSSGLVSALPALMSAEPIDMPPPYAYRSGSPTPSGSTFPSSTKTTALDEKHPNSSLTHRTTPQDTRTEAHTSLQTELSAQLEAMAAQLKRNALHFASALEKDKAVVEAALGKVEGNLGFMEGQRKRLRDFAGKSGGTTWLTLGIVLVVLAVFVMMVGFLRLTRI